MLTIVACEGSIVTFSRTKARADDLLTDCGLLICRCRVVRLKIQHEAHTAIREHGRQSFAVSSAWRKWNGIMMRQWMEEMGTLTIVLRMLKRYWHWWCWDYKRCESLEQLSHR